MTFFWWDDAMRAANRWATQTHIRHSVKAKPGGWVVEALIEVCS